MNRIPKDVQRIIGMYVHIPLWKLVMTELYVETYLIRVGFDLCQYVRYPVMTLIPEARPPYRMVPCDPMYSPPNWEYRYSRCGKCNRWRLTNYSDSSNLFGGMLPYCCTSYD